MNDVLQKKLLEAGADVVGFSNLRSFLHNDTAHLEKAISIGLRRNLNQHTFSLLSDLEPSNPRSL
jgi:hypothetical protein